MTQIRLVTPADLPVLVDIWHERALIQQQRLLPDARSRWSAAALGWLDDPDVRILTAETDEGQLAGYIVGRIQAAAPGTLPEWQGVVTEMAIDAHQYHRGAGRQMVEALRQWFASRQINRILVMVSPRSPVEQAFWRGLGASKWMEVLWIK